VTPEEREAIRVAIALRTGEKDPSCDICANALPETIGPVNFLARISCRLDRKEFDVGGICTNFVMYDEGWD
jgi:hypothetical protein